jgi:tRNA dimethylallyltransferase
VADLVCITGHTASGKSALALELAEALGAELLSVDSMQVYRGFDIGTAKPGPRERAAVRHHGLDLADPREPYSAGAFAEYAGAVLADAERRSVPVLAVGGTGLYLRALRFGLGPTVPAQPALRESLRRAEAAEPGALMRRLQSLDPAAAARIHPHDHVRLERAIEIVESTGLPLAAAHARTRAAARGGRLYAIRHGRDALRARIGARVDAMFDAGWVDEVRGLLDAGVPYRAPAMAALGYRPIADVLQGRASPEGLRTRVATAVWAFARRQTTWFNAEPEIVWLDAGPGLGRTLIPALRRLFAER